MNINKNELISRFKDWSRWDEKGCVKQNSTIEENPIVHIIWNNKKSKIVLSISGDEFFKNNNPEDCDELCMVNFYNSLTEIEKKLNFEGYKIETFKR